MRRAVSISDSAISRPGTIPAMNMSPIETGTPAVKAKMIIGMEGGMITPSSPDAACTDVAKGRG